MDTNAIASFLGDFADDLTDEQKADLARVAGRIGELYPADLLDDAEPGGEALNGATMAAFLAVCDPLAAAVAASVVHAVASERAAAVADGPGSFAVAFLDALSGVAPGDLADAGRLTVEPAGDPGDGPPDARAACSSLKARA